MSSRSGEACCELLYSVYFLLYWFSLPGGVYAILLFLISPPVAQPGGLNVGLCKFAVRLARVQSYRVTVYG